MRTGHVADRAVNVPTLCQSLQNKLESLNNSHSFNTMCTNALRPKSVPPQPEPRGNRREREACTHIR